MKTTVFVENRNTPEVLEAWSNTLTIDATKEDGVIGIALVFSSLEAADTYRRKGDRVGVYCIDPRKEE